MSTTTAYTVGSRCVVRIDRTNLMMDTSTAAELLTTLQAGIDGTLDTAETFLAPYFIDALHHTMEPTLLTIHNGSMSIDLTREEVGAVIDELSTLSLSPI
ncbi:hypothetical protein [Endothiovibrio diazotrophicus]